jgi:hypothetical protein
VGNGRTECSNRTEQRSAHSSPVARSALLQFGKQGHFGKSWPGDPPPFSKFMGLAQRPGGGKHRRLDVIIAPYKSLPFALLYFTGSAYLNRSMRVRAIQMGCSLSEHGLRTGCVYGPKRKRLTPGEFVPNLNSERDVFEYMGLPYLEPHEREHGSKEMQQN